MVVPPMSDTKEEACPLLSPSETPVVVTAVATREAPDYVYPGYT